MVVAVPHGGAGPAAFAAWPQLFAGSATVWAASMPGRGMRLLEPPLSSITEMADSLIEPVQNLAADELLLFGHCAGGLVAYEVAHRMASQGQTGHRVTLVVSGQTAPGFREAGSTPSMSDMSVADLVVHLRKLGETPERILRNQEMMRYIVSAIRADGQAVEAYDHPRMREKLQIPVIVVAAKNDSSIPSSRLLEWKDYTEGFFALHLLNSDHLSLPKHQHEIVDILMGI